MENWKCGFGADLWRQLEVLSNQNNQAKKSNFNLNQVHIRAGGEVRKRGGEEGRKLPKALLTRMVRIRLKTEVKIMMIVCCNMMLPFLCSVESKSIS